MSRAKRTKALAEFEKDDSVSVFLISIRAGAVGINLTVANYVFLMDPSLNPALEEQAVGRVREYSSRLSYDSYDSYDSYECSGWFWPLVIVHFHFKSSSFSARDRSHREVRVCTLYTSLRVALRVALLRYTVWGRRAR